MRSTLTHMKSSKMLRISAVGWVPLLLLLAQQLGCANAVPILSAARREEAFIGYSEQKAMRSATNCIDKETGCSRYASYSCILRGGRREYRETSEFS